MSPDGDRCDQEPCPFRQVEEEKDLTPAAAAKAQKKLEEERHLLSAVSAGRVTYDTCKSCGLWKKGCRIVGVSGSGDPQSRVWFVGEAPGRQEDRMGAPFVGPSGAVLEELLRCVGVDRERVYIDNVVRCRPPGNRDPSPKNMQLCSSYLLGLMQKYRPRAVVLLGGVALKLFVGQKGITKWRGKVLTYAETETFLIPTYHPAAILRDIENTDRNGTPIPIKYRGEQSERDMRLAFTLSKAKPRIGSYEKVLVTSGDEALRVIHECLAMDMVAVDIETTGLVARTDKIIGVSLCHDGKRAWYVPWPLLKSNEMATGALHDLLSEGALGVEEPVEIVMHNAKFDLRFLRRAGLTKAGCQFDTMLAHHALDENFGHGLKELAWLYTDLGGYEGAQAIGYEVPPEEIYEYACTDAIVTWKLASLFHRKIETEGLSPLFYEIIMPMVEVVLGMEESGLPFHVPTAKRLKRSYEKKVAKAEAKVHELAGHEFNIASTKQLQKVLFEELGLVPSKLTRTKQASTDEDVLKGLKKAHPIAKAILDYRKAKKILSTYVLSLLEKHVEGVVYTDFLQHGTVTGRLSSRNPNLQNVPDSCRSMFHAPKGWKFVEMDFAQAELRVVTHYTKDPVFVEAFEKGQDIHTRTAAEFYGLSMEEVTKKQRFLAKSINFGLLYGRGAKAIGEQCDMSEEKAEEAIAQYFQTYQATRQWMDDHIALAHKRGYVADPFGRKRRLHATINADDEWAMREAERQALNSPIQHGAAAATYIGLLRIQVWLRENGMRSYLCLTVHDSAMLCCPEDEVERVQENAKRLMEAPIPQLSIPMRVDIRVSDTWEKGED